MPLPIQITTSNGIEKQVIDKEGIKIQSSTAPLIDPNGYYLKKITMLP